MEGMFAYELRGDPDQKRYLKDLVRDKAPYKICALSQSFTSYLMWSHYSDGGRGLAFELDVHEEGRYSDAQGKRFEVAHVRYRSDPAYPLLKPNGYPDRIARDILLSKHETWRYEDEVRVLSDADYYEPISLRRVTSVIG